jgi:hypothetical protein
MQDLLDTEASQREKRAKLRQLKAEILAEEQFATELERADDDPLRTDDDDDDPLHTDDDYGDPLRTDDDPLNAASISLRS